MVMALKMQEALETISLVPQWEAFVVSSLESSSTLFSLKKSCQGTLISAINLAIS